MNESNLRQARGVLPYPKKDAVMGNPQATGLFVFLTLRPDVDEAAVRDFLAVVQSATEQLRAAEDAAGARVATVATGFSASFFGQPGSARFAGLTGVPAGLREPPAVAGSAQVPADICSYVVATSEGVAARFLAAVGGHPAVAAVAIERGYQRLDKSEPFGYRDGVRNVVRSQRREVVFVDRGELPEEPWWAHDGTYLAYLKVEQHPDVMKGLPETEQDAAIGRSRAGHRLDLPAKGQPDPGSEGPFTTDIPPVDSHVRKVGPRGDSHDTVQVFRRGLPFYEVAADGTLRVGLQFVSFQASLDAFDVVLNRWMTNSSFPAVGPGQPDLRDRLVTRGLIAFVNHGFFFVPPDTDAPIGDVMFVAASASKVPKTGRVAVRKKLLDAASGGRHLGELAGFTFRVVDPADPAQTALVPDFATDGKGHALSGDLPVGRPLRLLEVSGPPGPQLSGQVEFTLTSAREVIQVQNLVPAGSPY
jgi:deferrochelatase/peroxidase EfeB